MNKKIMTLIIKSGEALENCISALDSLGAPKTLCERIEAQEILSELNNFFGLKEGVSFSDLLHCSECGYYVSRLDAQDILGLIMCLDCATEFHF